MDKKTHEHAIFKTDIFICFSILLGVLIILVSAFHGKSDSDYLWHTVLFDYIVKHKSLPVQDVFSWRSIEMGYTEVAHSWFGSVLIGAVVRFFTGFGLAPLFGGRLFSLFWYIVCCLVIRCTFFRERVTWIYPIVCIGVVQMYGTVRVHNVSCILFALMIYILFNAKDMKMLAWLPVLTFLCANIHGGTVVLFLGVIFVYGLSQLVSGFEIGHFYHKPVVDKTMRFKYIGIWILSCLSTLLNPYGLRLYTYFLHIGSDNFSEKYVSEWIPVTSQSGAFRILLLILFIIIVQRRSVDILKYGMVFGFTVLSFIHVRFTLYGVVAAIPLLISYWDNVEIHVKAHRPSVSFDIPQIPIVLPAVSLILTLFMLLSFAFTICGDYGNRVSGLFSDEAIDYLSEKQFQRMFCDYNLGGKLIYSGFKSFVDSRADLFVEDELVDMVDLILQNRPAEELDAILAKYDFDAFFIPSYKYYGCQNYMATRDGWIEGYRDDQIVIYEKTDAPVT